MKKEFLRFFKNLRKKNKNYSNRKNNKNKKIMNEKKKIYIYLFITLSIKAKFICKIKFNSKYNLFYFINSLKLLQRMKINIKIPF